MTMLLDVLKPIRLLSGSHADTGQTGQGCFMNVIAYLNGEPQITDRSPCVCVVVRPIAIWINDYLIDSERQILLPYIERAMSSATRDKAELARRAARAVQLAKEARDIACTVLDDGSATDAAHAASEAARAATDPATVSTYAARACTYAAKASDYADELSSERTGGSYFDARHRIIDSCLHFLDDCLPGVDSVVPVTVERAERLAVLADR